MTRLLLCAALCLAAACHAANLPNLVQNPGFETKGADGLPEGWKGPTNVYSHVTTPVHSGTGALHFVNSNAGNYALCNQPIPLQPGKMYEFSAWVKCEDVVGNDNGATICLEWYGADDAYLGGSYPAGIKGTKGWTQVKAQCGRVPDKAAHCSVTCYVRKGMTGKAWWDDVEVRQWLEPPLYTMLTKPNYRGIITPDLEEVELAADLKLEDYGLTPGQVELSAVITKRDATEPLKSTRLSPTSATARLSLPTDGLAPGDYLLRVFLRRQDDRQRLAADQWRLTVVPPGDLQKRTAYIDDHNRLIVDGKPFFPLGCYFSGLNEDELKQYADSAFNCVMPYGGATREKMDLLQSLGLKIIYTLKDVYYGSHYCPKSIRSPDDERPFMEAKTKEFGNHPALLAWYLNDELSTSYMPRLEAHQEWMETLDPNHPTWIVLYQVGQLDLYRRTYDVLGTDPYPIPMAPARRAADYTKASMRSVMNSRPVWQVPQIMNWANYKKTEEEKKGLRPPTYDEMRSMTWQCLTEGATGLIYYCWPDLKKESEVFDRRWAEVKRVAAEVKQWSQMLLSIEDPPKITVEQQDWLHWTVRKAGDTVYLFAVNDEEKEHQATFTLPRPPGRVKLGDEIVTPRGAQWTARFQPFELKVYEITP
ncbi:MAG: carbohydrate binding domain-containing protein [Armatimonadetes bacterium]|nr:carbohydrate binding domain-containing protein [Armatimonadota bacterium]